MALKVGELFATLKLDSKGFDDGLDKSKRSFDGLRTGIEKGTKAAATVFATTTTAVAGLGIAALKVGLDYNRMQQSSRAALETLLGSAEAANAQMDKLDEFAKTSPFAKQVFIQAQQQMLGFGIEAEKVIPALDSIQNAVASMGGSNEDIAAIVDTLAKMESQGRLSGETLRELGHYGIDAATIVGEKMGKTGEEIRKLASKPGGIPVDQVWDPLVDGLMDRFGGATDKIKEQMDGAADRVKAAWRDIGSVMAEPLIDPMGGGMLVEWTNAFADAMRSAEQKTRPLVDLLVNRYQPAIDAVTPALQQVKEAINSWDLSKINTQLDEMGRYAPLIAGTSTALFAMGSTSLPLIGRFVPAINPLVAGLGAMVAFSPELRTMGAEFFQALSPLLPVAKDLGRALADTLMQALHRLTPAIGDVLLRAADLAVLFGTALVPSITSLMDAALPLVGVLADVVSWISELPTPVLLTVAALTAMKSLNIGPLLNTTLAGGFRAIKSSAETAALQMMYVRDGAGGLKAAFQPLRGVISGVGTALKTAFISNAPMLALTALTGAVAAFATAQAEAKQRTEEYKQTLDELGDTTAETVDKINSELARDRASWSEKLFGGDANSLIDDADRLGVAVEDMIGVILEEEGATQRVTAATDAYIAARQGSTREYNDAVGYVNRFRNSIDQEKDALSDAEKEVQRKRRADEAAGVAQRDATSAVDEHRQAQENLRNELREAADASLSAADAAMRLADAEDRTTEALQVLRDAQKDLDRVTKDANATDKEKEEATRAVERATRDADKAIREEVKTVWDDIDAKRRNNAENWDLYDAVMQARDGFIKQRMSMGDTRQEAQKLADEYGLFPSSVLTTIEMQDLVSGPLKNVVQKLKDFNGKTYTAIAQVNQRGHVQQKYFPNSGLIMNADGGIVTRYANGGIDGAGRHVPRISQVVTGGRNILWGEPETGWESYISGKPSARQRNLAVMDETARRLGGVFIRPGDLRMADGGTTGPQRTETITSDSGQRPIYITINSVESDHVDETAKALNFALRTRGGLYSRS